MSPDAPGFAPGPVTLQGRHVRLEPLGPGHLDDLFAAGAEEEIWTWLPEGPFASAAEMAPWLERAVAGTAAGEQVAFAIVPLDTGRAGGSTRFLDIRPDDRGLEIGWTWIGADHRRTPVNTECKRLLLGHAFDDLGAVRVQLKTDARNLRSQTAIERIGAEREGVLRRHMLTRGGFIRDSVLYSVTDGTWPDVKARLDSLLDR